VTAPQHLTVSKPKHKMTDTNANDFRLGKGNVKRTMKDATDMRVADDAAMQILVEEEDRIQRIARAAKIISNEAGRQTILERDVRSAYKIGDLLE